MPGVLYTAISCGLTSLSFAAPAGADQNLNKLCLPIHSPTGKPVVLCLRPHRIICLFWTYSTTPVHTPNLSTFSVDSYCTTLKNHIISNTFKQPSKNPLPLPCASKLYPIILRQKIFIYIIATEPF